MLAARHDDDDGVCHVDQYLESRVSALHSVIAASFISSWGDHGVHS